MTYTELMEAVLTMKAELRIIPATGFITVKLVHNETVLSESNFGWHSFKTATIDSFKMVVASFMMQKLRNEFVAAKTAIDKQ